MRGEKGKEKNKKENQMENKGKHTQKKIKTNWNHRLIKLWGPPLNAPFTIQKIHQVNNTSLSNNIGLFIPNCHQESKVQHAREREMETPNKTTPMPF